MGEEAHSLSLWAGAVGIDVVLVEVAPLVADVEQGRLGHVHLVVGSVAADFVEDVVPESVRIVAVEHQEEV